MRVKLILEKAKETIVKLAENQALLKPFLNVVLADLESAIERISPSNYLLLPESKEHPDLTVSLGKVSYGPEMEELAKGLKLNLRNNAQGYIGNINFEQAESLCEGLEGFMTTPSLFVEKLRLLRSEEAYDAQGNKHDSKRLDQAFNEITEVRSPWRSECLNHRYSQKGNEIFVTYHKFVNGKLEQVTEPLDEDTLMQDKTPGISLDDYIENPNSQGLPRKSVKKGSLWYWHPREGRVARFDADADWADLNCNGGPRYSVSDDGVAVVREKTLHNK